MTQWPETLPIPFIDYTGEPLQATIVSGAENARLQRRARYRASYVRLNVRWVFDLAQFDIWEAFFLNDLDNGASQFSIDLKHPTLSALTNWVVRIVGGYIATHDAGNWIVELTLDLLRAPLPDASPLLGWVPFHVIPEPAGAHIPFVDAAGFYYAVKE